MKADSFFQKANPQTLFQTHAWRESWELAWGDSCAQELSDWYRAERCIRNLLKIISLYPRGSSSPQLRSLRSEYFYHSLADQSDSWRSIFALGIDQVVLPDVVQGSAFERALRANLDAQGVTILTAKRERAYSVDTATGRFEDYLQALEGRTRAKLYNRRQRLAQMGEIGLSQAQSASEFIDQLNEFHRQRWHKPCYQGRNEVFIRNLLQALPREGHKVILSQLTVSGQVVSLLLDIQVGERIYNLQSGFIEQFGQGLSLGILHLGYAIEQAFSDPDVSAYDFMAGVGKRTDYKQKLASQYCHTVDLICLRSRWLIGLYQLQAILNRINSAGRDTAERDI